MKMHKFGAIVLSSISSPPALCSISPSKWQVKMSHQAFALGMIQALLGHWTGPRAACTRLVLRSVGESSVRVLGRRRDATLVGVVTIFRQSSPPLHAAQHLRYPHWCDRAHRHSGRSKV